MAEIIMPKMGDAMTEGKVVRWYKKAGDVVKKGEPVLEIETDKVNLDLEAEQDGTIGEVEVQEGQMAPVGGRLAVISAPGEKPPERRATDKKDSVKHTTGEYAEAIEMKAPRIDRSAPLRVVEGGGSSSSGKKRSSPLARKMAQEMGVTLDAIQGSGPQGRIIARDIKSVQKEGPARAPATTQTPPQKLETKQIPLSAMRRTIAKRLAESTGPIPHFYLTADYDVTTLLSLRLQLNASWGDDAITQYGEIHIGVAVSTPEGLITPVVRNADQKSVMEIANDVRALADKAKNRKLRPEEYQGSTFTISNLGAWGIEEFTAIINPPNVAILAIGAAASQPVVIDKQVVVRDRMKITMSCDHRVVDGAAGAEYLKTLRQYLEQPVRLIV